MKWNDVFWIINPIIVCKIEFLTDLTGQLSIWKLKLQSIKQIITTMCVCEDFQIKTFVVWKAACRRKFHAIAIIGDLWTTICKSICRYHFKNACTNCPTFPIISGTEKVIYCFCYSIDHGYGWCFSRIFAGVGRASMRCLTETNMSREVFLIFTSSFQLKDLPICIPHLRILSSCLEARISMNNFSQQWNQIKLHWAEDYLIEYLEFGQITDERRLIWPYLES